MMEPFPVELLNAIENLAYRVDLSKRIVRRILKLNPRPSNADGFKYFIIRYLIEKGCRIVTHETETTRTTMRKVPVNFSEPDSFLLIFKSYSLKLLFIRLTDAVMVHLLYSPKKVVKTIIEPTSTLPNISDPNVQRNVDNADKDEVIYSYNEIMYRLEADFYRPILRFMEKNMEPHSPTRTPEESDGSDGWYDSDTQTSPCYTLD